MALWAGVDGFVCDYCRFFWHGILQSIYKTDSVDRALPFALNLFFNFIFTPIQFGLKNNLLASLDILFVVGTLIWALYAVWHAVPSLRWVVYANIPYLLWGTFATVLQLTITYLNA